MGVEINPALCAAATENFQLNCITNASVVVADSAKFATQILRTKQYRLYAKVEKSPTPVHIYKPDSTAVTDTTLVGLDTDPAHTDADVLHIHRTPDSSATAHEPAGETSGEAAGEEPKKKVKVLTEAQKARAIRKAAAVAAQNANKPAKAEPLYVFEFCTVLVDPPRCGLDALTLSLVANYEHILYISCCPDSLMRDLTEVRLCIFLQPNVFYTCLLAFRRLYCVLVVTCFVWVN